MSKISKRAEYAPIIEGYCQICGSFSKLSRDHVPPKCIKLAQKVEQKLVMEVMTQKKVNGVQARAGSIFKTICAECNRSLSISDSEIKKVTNELNTKITELLASPFNMNSVVSVKTNIELYLKGMVGHMLAAVPNKYCEKNDIGAPFLNPLREFVLGNNDDIEKTHSFYYWFYPNRMSVAGNGFAILDPTVSAENVGVSGCLYFYPVALLVTKKGRSFQEISGIARQLTLTDVSLYLDVSLKNQNNSIFPFFGLTHSMLAMNDAAVTAITQSSFS